MNPLAGYWCMNLRSMFARKTSAGSSLTVPSQPVEVGTVTWLRDLDQAVGLSAQSGRPVFALFQEVPGCAGCKQFGKDVLSNRVVVDGIEEAFVPLLIHNNTPGQDAVLLEAFGEPAWNFQVVRFLDAEANDIIARRDRVWETGPLVSRMVETLVKAQRAVPAYLRLIEQEHSDRLSVAHFAQPCFWVGEHELAQIEGVVTTQAGFMAGHEITSVTFDPEQVTLRELSLQARHRGVASLAFVDDQDKAALQDTEVRVASINAASYRVAPKSDQKRQINRLGRLNELSLAQRTKLNGLLRSNSTEAAQFLPPSQRHLLR